MKQQPKPYYMINLKLQINYEGAQHFQKSLQLMFNHAQQNPDFSYLDFYNLSALLKKLFDKLFKHQLNKKGNCFALSVNINEHASMIPLYFNYRKFFPEQSSVYLENLWRNIF